MEERQNMVREYLVERERAERTHRTRADKIMKQFSKKMSALEDTLSTKNEADERRIKSTPTQTSFEEDDTLHTDKNMEEIIQALTEDMQDVVNKQLTKEKMLMFQELETRKNEMDMKEIDMVMEDIIEQKQVKYNDTYSNQKEESVVKELINLETDEKVQEDLVKIENKLLTYFEGKEIIDNVDECVMKKIIVMKQSYLQQKEDFLKTNYENYDREFETNSNVNILELRNVCRLIDDLEDNFNTKLHDIKGKLTQPDFQEQYEQMVGLTVNDRKTVIDQLLEQSVEMTSDDKKETKQLIGELKNTNEELEKKQIELNELLLLKFNDLGDNLLKQHVVNVSMKNKSLVQEKEKLLKIIQGNGSDDIDIKASTKFYIEPIYTETNEEECFEKLIKVKPRIGKNLLNNLLKMESLRVNETADIVHYQDKQLECVIEEYEKEIKKLSDDFNKAVACCEVSQLALEKPFVRETLLSEQEKIVTELTDNKSRITEVKVKLTELKLYKDKLLLNEEILLNKKGSFCVKLKEINKEIADKLMQRERENEKCISTKKLEEINEEIENIENAMMVNNTEMHTCPTNPNTPIKEGKTEAIRLTHKLQQLQCDLKKLAPYVSSNNQSLKITNEQGELPDSKQVDDLVHTRKDLTEKLLTTENKLQDMVISQLDASNDGSLDQIEDFNLDSPVAKDGLVDRIIPRYSPNLELNDKVLELQVELTKINEEMDKHQLQTDDLADLKDNSKDLKTTLNAFDRKLKSSLIPRPKVANKELRQLKEEKEKLKKKLKDRGIYDCKYDSDKIEILEKSKEIYEEKLRRAREKSNVESFNGNAVSDAMKELLQERDRTKNIIMGLEEDIKQLSNVEMNMSNCNSINERMLLVEKELLQKKADNVTTVIAIANDRLGKAIDLVKKKLKAKVDEAKQVQWKNKQMLTEEEKKKLGKELKDIVLDIKQAEIEIKEIDKFKLTGSASKSDHALLITLSEKKKDLVCELDEINESIEQKVGLKLENDTLKQLLTKKVEIKEQLADLDERIGDQKRILKQKLKTLVDIKFGLEKKLAEGINVQDLQNILSALDQKSQENVTNNDFEGGTDTLMKKRKSLTSNMMEVLDTSSPVEKGKVKKISKVISDVDGEIVARMETIFVKLHEIDATNDATYNFSFDVMSNTAAIHELIHDKKELERAMSIAELKQTDTIDHKSLSKFAEDIKELKDLKSVLTVFQKRKLEVNHIADMCELKSLNEEKLDRLLSKIKNLNALMQKHRKLDKKKEGSKELSSKNIKKLSATADMISKELETIIRSYEEDVKRNESVALIKPYLCGSPPPKPDNLSLLLEKRDEKLNYLFFVEKNLENAEKNDTQQDELNDEKKKLEKEIDEIDERIVQGEFAVSVDNVNISSPARSFSPRSTSSRNSFMSTLDERDSLLRSIFQIQRKQKKLRESKGTFNKQANLWELEASQEELQNNLKEVDKKIFKNDSDSDTSIEEKAEQKGATYRHVTDENMNSEIAALKQELKDHTIRLRERINSSLPVDKNDIITDPVESNILNTIQDLKDQLEIEKLKMDLFTLEGQRNGIEENSKERRSPDRNLLKKEEAEKKASLEEVNLKIALITKKQETEINIKNLKEEIASNERLTKKIESRNHKEFVKAEKEITIKEYSASKASLEKKLDEVNDVINLYTRLIKVEISKSNVEKQTKESNDLMQHELLESVDALKSYKLDLEEHVEKLTKGNNIVTRVSIPELLTKRRDTISKLQEVTKKIERKNNEEDKQNLTIELRKCHEENKRLILNESQMEYKLKLLQEKIREIENDETIDKFECDIGKIKSLLGDNLYNMLKDQDHHSSQEEYLSELKQCLNDRTVSTYLKDMFNLKSSQTEQIDHLKNELQKVIDKGMEVETENMTKENEMLSLKKVISSQEKNLINVYDQIEKFNSDLIEKDNIIANKKEENRELKETVNERTETLNELTKQLHTIRQNDRTSNEIINRFSESLGNGLYHLIAGTGPIEYKPDSKLYKCLEKVKTLIETDKINLETILLDNYNEVETSITRYNEFERKLQDSETEYQKHIKDVEIKFKSKLGETLYLILSKTEFREIINDPYLENVKQIIDGKNKTIEEILHENFEKIESISKEKEEINYKLCKSEQNHDEKVAHLQQENETKIKKIQSLEVIIQKDSDLIDRLNEDKRTLQKQRHDVEDQLELLKRREDDLYSETESLRDNLHQCASKTTIIYDEAAKLKNGYEDTKQKLDYATVENGNLKKLLKEKDLEEISVEGRIETLTREIKQLKKDLESANEENKKEVTNKKLLREEIEDLRKKLKNISRVKDVLEENMETEVKKTEMMQGDLKCLEQKENLAKSDLQRSNTILEKKLKEMNMIKEAISQKDKENNDLRNTVNEMEKQYQELSNKYQKEITKNAKDLRTYKREHEIELEKLKREKEIVKEELIREKTSYEYEKSYMETEHNTVINQYKDEMENASNKLDSNMNDLASNILKLEMQNKDLRTENQVLLVKIHDMDESFETELTENRNEMNDNYNKSIDKLNEKIRALASDIIAIEKAKDEIEDEANRLKTDNNDLLSRLKEQALISEENEHTQRIRMAALLSESEGLKLENNEFADDIKDLRRQLKRQVYVENSEKEVKERKRQLDDAARQLTEDKIQLELSIQEFMKKSSNDKNNTGNSGRKSDERVSIKLLRICQEERDKMSEELIHGNRDLNNAKNELRKVKNVLSEKEQDHIAEEEQLVVNMEKELKQRTEDLRRNYLKEREKLIKIQNEERIKWEEEMNYLKKDLHDENLRNLMEQRSDFEKELEEHIYYYLKQTKDEIDELQEKNEFLKNEKMEILRQFESDKTTLKRQHESERYALEETIRRLLDNVMKYKQQKNR